MTWRCGFPRLPDEFQVTTETIRRDLDELSDRGLISRTYGGAAPRSLIGEPGVLLRAQANVAERQRIALAATSLVKPGDVVMIDAGSTTAFFAAELAKSSHPLTAITNSLGVARALGASEAITRAALSRRVSHDRRCRFRTGDLGISRSLSTPMPLFSELGASRRNR